MDISCPKCICLIIDIVIELIFVITDRGSHCMSFMGRPVVEKRNTSREIDVQ